MIPNYSNPMAHFNGISAEHTGSSFLGNLKKLGNTGGPTEPPEQVFQPSWMQSLTGFTDNKGIKTDGWGGMALGAAQGLGGAYLGMKQYGMAQKQLSESKRQFDTNFNAQRQMVNTDLEDRQRARVASNAGAYESVGSYMNKNKVV